MKQPSALILISIALASCTPMVQTAVAQSVPAVTDLPATTSTQVISTLEPTSTTTPFPTTPACDPLTADFCITDGHFIFHTPIFPPGNTFVDVSYRYGSTEDNRREPHHGVEFINKFGTPVHAAQDGLVQYAGPDKEAVYSPWKNFYGNLVVIKHEDDLFTLYAHLSRVTVITGDVVKAGDLIGDVGQSGVATGSHLHFEVRQGGDGTDYFSTQNPELWLIPNTDGNGKSLGAISIEVVDQNSTQQFADITLQYYQDKNGAKLKNHYLDTYPKDMMLLQENAGLADLRPGYYFISLRSNGRVYDRWVEVESGKLTQVVFVVK